jgi:hypothetical protein
MLRVRRVNTARNQQMKVASSAYFSLCPIFRWFVGLLLDPEGGGDMVLQNVRLSWNYTFLTTQKARSFIVLILNVVLVFNIYSLLVLIQDVQVYKMRCDFLDHFQEQTSWESRNITVFFCREADQTHSHLSTVVLHFLTLINNLL